MGGVCAASRVWTRRRRKKEDTGVCVCGIVIIRTQVGKKVQQEEATEDKKCYFSSFPLLSCFLF